MQPQGEYSLDEVSIAAHTDCLNANYESQIFNSISHHTWSTDPVSCSFSKTRPDFRLKVSLIL